VAGALLSEDAEPTLALNFNSDRTAATVYVRASTPASASAVVPSRQAGQHACIGALLVQRHVITEAQLRAAIEQQQLTGRRLAQVLIEMGATTQDVVIGTLTVQLNMHGTRAQTCSEEIEPLTQERM
jgi:hypothetical protein